MTRGHRGSLLLRCRTFSCPFSRPVYPGAPQSFSQHRFRHTATASSGDLPGPVPVGVRVEHRLHRLLQPGRDHCLRYPVRDARHPENSGPAAMRFRYLHRSHRGREIASPTTSGSRSYRGCSSDPPRTPRSSRSSTPGAPLLAFTFCQASHTSHFGISNGFPGASAHSCGSSRNLPVDRTNQPRMTRPLRSARHYSGLHRYYEPVRQRAPHRYSAPRGSCRLRALPLATRPALGRTRRQYQRAPSHVPCGSRRPGSRRLHAGHHLASQRAPARLIPGRTRTSRF